MSTKGDKTKSHYDKYQRGKSHNNLFEVDGLINTKIYIGDILQNKTQRKSFKLFNGTKTFKDEGSSMAHEGYTLEYQSRCGNTWKSAFDTFLNTFKNTQKTKNFSYTFG